MNCYQLEFPKVKHDRNIWTTILACPGHCNSIVSQLYVDTTIHKFKDSLRTGISQAEGKRVTSTKQLLLLLQSFPLYQEEVYSDPSQTLQTQTEK